LVTLELFLTHETKWEYRMRYTCLVAVLIALAGCGQSNDVDSNDLFGAEEGMEYPPLGDNGSTTLSVSTELGVYSNVNLRETPSADARVLIVVPKDATVTVVGRTEPENGYYQVDYLGRTGWAYGAYLFVDRSATTSALTDNQRENIMDRARASAGYSYWWGHGRFGCGLAHGNCSGGGCPSCSHSGPAGADCSGMVAKAWAVPASAPGTCVDGHPYSSTTFATTTIHWHNIDRSNIQRADAFVLKGGGHIMIRGVGTSSSGQPHIIECSGCAAGCIIHYRSVSSDFKAIRRNENI